MNDDDKENLRKEYEMCSDNWRFFVGLRFTVLAFFLTLNSGLLYAFFNMLDKSQQQWFVFFPPLIGIISVAAAWMIENRIRQMYFACIQRAKAIELKSVSSNKDAKKKRWVWPWEKNKPNVEEEAKNFNLLHILDNRCPTSISSSQTWAIRLVYSMLIVVWFVLIFAIPGLASKVILTLSSFLETLEFGFCELFSW